MKKLLFTLISIAIGLSGYAQGSCTGTTTTFDNTAIADYSTSTVFGDGTIGYVTVCIEAGSVIGADMCGANDEGIIIRESDGTILGYVTAATPLPACYTSTVQDGIMNVSDICATGSSFNISWETTDSPTGGGVDQCDHCLNGIQDVDETNVDCGGADCLPCGPAHCYNGIMDSDEVDVDCGGSCNGFGGTACCTNGYLDYNEFAVDCGSGCGAPSNDVCVDAISYSSTGGSGCNYNATDDGVPASWAPDAGNGPMDFSSVCDLYNIDPGTFRWVSHNNGVFYTLTWSGGDLNIDVTNISCTGNGVIQMGLWSASGSCDMDAETLEGCAMTDQVDMTLSITSLPAGDYMLFVDGADGSQCTWTFPGALLGMRMLNLNYELKGDDVNLIVTNTEKEKQVKSYVIEKSTDGIYFSPITTILADKSEEYTFLDATSPARRVYYKTTEILENGHKGETSVTLKVSRDIQANSVKVLHSGEDYTFILDFPGSQDNGEFNLIDIAGRTVHSEKVALENGYGNVKLNSARFERGIYQVIVTGNGLEQQFTKKIILE